MGAYNECMFEIENLKTWNIGIATADVRYSIEVSMESKALEANQLNSFFIFNENIIFMYNIVDVGF